MINNDLPTQYDRLRLADYGRKAEKDVVEAFKNARLTNAAGQTIIKVKRTTLTGTANSITQRENAKGGIDRNYYGSDGQQIKQVSNNNHGNSKSHPYGTNGEHAHDYLYDESGKLIGRTAARELTSAEREENGDIL